MLAFSEPYFKSGAALIALKKNMATHTGEETEVEQQGFLQSVKTSFVSNLIEEDRYLIILDGLKITCMISTLNPQLHSRSATYIKRNGLLIRKTAIKSSHPFQYAYHPLTP